MELWFPRMGTVPTQTKKTKTPKGASELLILDLPHPSSSSMIIQVANEQILDNLGRAGSYSGSLDQRTRRPHGEGHMEYEDSSNDNNEIMICRYYEGQWFLGDWSGFGKIEYRSTGNSYEGTFLDNQKHGLGVMIYASNDERIVLYDGTFQFDKMVGKGKLMYRDGSIYWGSYYDWSSSLPHGRGKLTYPNGAVYDGEFERGCIQGHGRMTLPDGSWYLGEWGDGKKHGIGLDVMADGHVRHEGTFCNDLPVICSSFPQRKRSTGTHLLYRSASSSSNNHGCSNSRNALVGPIPRQLRMQSIFVRRRRELRCYN
jgi:hypothetical protein